ncbi:MAG: MFS transporter [Candidatus Aminicenantes bacterium]|nr:MAG: MFS transporter [Candidatus Aminicenantes bacterium]
MTNLRSNLWKIYIYRFLNEFWLVLPILIPYYEANRLNSTQIFTIQAAYALSILLMEIPSGYLADVIGRKKTLILGACFLPVGIGVYVFTHSFATFILAEFIIAIGNSMRSGCDSALIYDTLIQLKEEAEYKKFEGRSFYYTRVGTAISSILGGVTALISLRVPFYINMGVCLFMIPFALLLIEPKREKLKAQSPFKDILKISRLSFSHKQLRLLMLLTALLMSTGAIGIWAYFLYYESIGISIGFFGVLMAAFQLSAAVSSRQAHTLEKFLGQRQSLLILLLMALTFVLLGIFQSLVLIPLILLNAFLMGFGFPLLMDHMNRLIESKIRATVLSVANMTRSLSYVILSPLFGKVVDSYSLSTAFILLGVFFFLFGSTVIALLLARLRLPEKKLQEIAQERQPGPEEFRVDLPKK